MSPKSSPRIEVLSPKSATLHVRAGDKEDHIVVAPNTWTVLMDLEDLKPPPAPRIWCRLGLHDWSRWKRTTILCTPSVTQYMSAESRKDYQYERPGQSRECRSCGKEQFR